MKLGDDDLKELEIGKEKAKDELEQMLFEVCESWVLRGEMPDLKFN